MFLVMDNTVARQAIAENGRKWQKIEVRLNKDDICQKWQEMDFRVFLVMIIEVARKTIAEMAENGEKGFPRLFGRKWISACFSSIPYYYQQISIHSNHSIVSLSNPIFLIIRSNQCAINIEQILIQTIIWL